LPVATVVDVFFDRLAHLHALHMLRFGFVLLYLSTSSDELQLSYFLVESHYGDIGIGSQRFHPFASSFVRADVVLTFRKSAEAPRWIYLAALPFAFDLYVLVQDNSFVRQAQAPSFGLMEAKLGWGSHVPAAASGSQQSPVNDSK
jgi:hypothetical protein